MVSFHPMIECLGSDPGSFVISSFGIHVPWKAGGDGANSWGNVTRTRDTNWLLQIWGVNLYGRSISLSVAKKKSDLIPPLTFTLVCH